MSKPDKHDTNEAGGSPTRIYKGGSSMHVVPLPVPDRLEVKRVLEKALADDLTNVIVLSQREDGNIYHAYPVATHKR